MFTPVEGFIAWRYTRARRRNQLISFIAATSIAGVTLGIAALLTILAIMNGFEREMRERLLGMAAHLDVTAVAGASPDWRTVARLLSAQEGVLASAPYMQGQAMVTSLGQVQGAVVHGIDPAREAHVSVLAQRMQRGALSSLTPGQFNLVIGRGLANALRLAGAKRLLDPIPGPASAATSFRIVQGHSRQESAHLRRDSSTFCHPSPMLIATAPGGHRSRPLLNWLRKFSRFGGGAPDTNAAEQQYELGRSMRGIGEPARAVTCFRKAIELDPGHLDARIDLASALLGLGAPDAAERAARGALLLDARSIAAHVNLGAALADQGKFAGAADSYRAALAIDADCAPALANLGTACLQIGQVAEARRCADHGLRISPNDPEAHLRLGNVLMEQRQPARAAESYREALRLNPRLAAGYNCLGFALDMQGKLEDANGSYLQALALEPENVQEEILSLVRMFGQIKMENITM